jgi:hypothetical protein
MNAASSDHRTFLELYRSFIRRCPRCGQ